VFCSLVSYADVLFFISLKEREEVSEEVDGWNMLKPDTQNSSDDFLSVSTPFFCDFLCLCGRRIILCILSKTRSETGYIGVAVDPTGVFYRKSCRQLEAEA